MVDDKRPPEDKDDIAADADSAGISASQEQERLEALGPMAAPRSGAGYETDDDDSINQGIPAVASGGTKNVFVLGVGLIVVAIFLYNVLSGDDAAQQAQQDAEQDISVPTNVAVPPPPPVVDDPMQVVAPPPPPPPPPLAVNTSGTGDVSTGGPGGIASRGLSLPPERAKSALIVGSNSLLPTGIALQGGAQATGSSVTLEDTTSPQVNATYAGEPINMIAQGKIIDAVLETAVNSDLSGILRAVVSRDIYAEAGKRILLPKGSRLVGTYDVQVKRGQSRVFIVWNRVLRPDGIDVVITSPSSDHLGRAGVAGEVDNKYMEIFSNSILLSSITVGYAFAAEKALDTSGLTETENTSGSLTTSGTPSAIAAVEAIDDFGDVVKGVMAELVDLRPTITINQGTRVKVFVNKDLKFPDSIASDVVFIK